MLFILVKGNIIVQESYLLIYFNPGKAVLTESLE